MARRPADARRVRRSPHLVLHWKRGTLVLRNYATGRAAAATPLVCRVLDFCSDWRTCGEIRDELGIGSDSFVRTLVRRLLARSFVEQAGRRQDPRVRAMSALDCWNPEAGFFHTSTRDVRFLATPGAWRHVPPETQSGAMPRAVKRYPRASTIPLPRPEADPAFSKVVLARRTWRRFSVSPASVDEIATILGLACGVQQWVRAAGGEAPLKTSPSGGARHPIEAYVVARDVRGLKPGVYHYAADRHALSRLRGPVAPARLRAYLPGGGYFAAASALVFFTAVFERQIWRYRYSRAYRASLIEAGHVCQTFLLAATSLGLAPFSLIALADSVIEKDLGIDGIGESVLYCAGVGRPPRGSSWAPLPRGHLTTRPNPAFRPTGRR